RCGDGILRFHRSQTTTPSAAALTQKPSARLPAAMNTPASAGATIRVRLYWAELSATALQIEVGSTTVATTAWPVGIWTVSAIPDSNARTSTCQYWTTPSVVSSASAVAHRPTTPLAL